MNNSTENSSTPASWWNKTWAQRLIITTVGVLAVYGMIYRDVVSRAHECFEKGETYLAWHQNPKQKIEDVERQFAADKKQLDEQLERKKLTQEEYRRKLDVLEFDKKFVLEESSAKYAFQWYKDAYELFSPPESTWVKLAREKAPQALALWKAELKSKNIPYEEYMFD